MSPETTTDDAALGELAKEVRRLRDESDLRQLLQHYAKGIIEGDRELVLGCFTDDLRLDYGFTMIEGKAGLREFLFGNEQRDALPVKGLSTAITRTQLFTTLVVSLDESTADLESSGMSAHGGIRGDDSYVVVRSLRYHDRCVRTADGWRIRHRRYTPQWAFEAPASVVVALTGDQR